MSTATSSSPLAASRIPHWRPGGFPADGHESSPRMAMVAGGGVVTAGLFCDQQRVDDLGRSPPLCLGGREHVGRDGPEVGHAQAAATRSSSGSIPARSAMVSSWWSWLGPGYCDDLFGDHGSQGLGERGDLDRVDGRSECRSGQRTLPSAWVIGASSSFECSRGPSRTTGSDFAPGSPRRADYRPNAQHPAAHRPESSSRLAGKLVITALTCGPGPKLSRRDHPSAIPARGR